jgi:hypothetical protein
MTIAVKHALTPAEVALAYHARTKHSLQQYAAGPETLDWDMQPNPFPEFAGSARIPLVLTADQVGTSFAQVYAPDARGPRPLTIGTVGTLLELSMGLAAWKEYGPDRWALRCNPSSGNLHPTEAYVVSSNVPGLNDGLYHYSARDHILEHRSRHVENCTAPPRLWIGLASVHWGGTGIGCYFDDAMHDLLGIQGMRFQGALPLCDRTTAHRRSDHHLACLSGQATPKCS